MAKTMETDVNQINIIKAGTTITGDISCTGDIRFEGGLIGNLKVQGRVVVGASGTVKGEIICKNAEIEGKVEGKISVTELLSLKSTSLINGDIKTKKLAIEPGANFSGSCLMNNGSDAMATPLKTNEEKRR